MNLIDSQSKEKINAEASIKENLITYSFYWKPGKTVNASPKILEKSLEQRLIILQSEINLKIGSIYDASLQGRPFEITVGKKLSIEFDKLIQDGVLVTVKKRVNKDLSYQEEKKISVNSQSQALGLFNGNFDYMIDISKDGFEFKVEKSENENGDVLFKVGTTEISRINILIKNTEGYPVPNATVYITSSERGKNVKIVEQTDKNGRILHSIY